MENILFNSLVGSNYHGDAKGVAYKLNGKGNINLISWSPKSGHHGNVPYWKISSSKLGTVRYDYYLKILIDYICFLISVLGGHVICNIINNNLTNMLNKVSLLVFGIPSIILILGLSIIVALISTFTPVLLISIKKPVESIKSI